MKFNASLFLSVCLLFLSSSFFAQAPDSPNAYERITLESEVLKDVRDLQIYLPPSYFSDKGSSYPVLYLLDGDYNFQYVTGLIALMSGIAEEIPQMIVVGIADGGHRNYAQQCNPSIGEQAGDGDKLIAFIETEVKPRIEKDYRCAGYDILQGHSRGGLFVTYAALEKPKLFDAYTAISPALWWQDYALLEHAKTKLASEAALPFRYFLSLGNEKEMGVNRLADFINTKFPDDPNFKYSLFENENHNYVGLPSIRIALKTIFKDYEVNREKFMSFDTPSAMADHYLAQKAAFGFEQRIPWSLLGNAVYFYFSRDKMEELALFEKAITEKLPVSAATLYSSIGGLYLEKENYTMARKYFAKCMDNNPLAYECHFGMGKVSNAIGENMMAQHAVLKALKLAEDSRTPQWAINELESWLTK